MRLPFLVIATLTLVSATSVQAQESSPLPAIVRQHIDDDTLLVARLKLTQPGIDHVISFLADLPDPSRWFGLRTVDFHDALNNLQAARLSNTTRFTEVFLVLSTYDLPLDNLALIVPVTGNDGDRQAVVEALKRIGQGQTDVSAEGVVYWTRRPRTDHPAARHVRPEFHAALTAIQDQHIQVSVCPGPDARRVLREFWPVLPAELGGGSGLILIDGLKWIALGITPTDKPELRYIVQGSDEQYTASAEKVLQAALKLAAAGDVSKSVGVNLDKLFGLLKPTRMASQLSIVIDKSNGAQAAVVNELAVPLLVRLQRNALIRRTNDNLKQLGLAMHNYHDVYGGFPAPATLSPDGKKLLSWRVALLPYLDHGPLYKEFHLNEPWDSEHNRQLIARMPDVFASASTSGKQRAQGLTTYLGINADKCLFAGPDGKKIKQIKDGTSNTICIVDANADRAMVWTQPGDLQVDLQNPLLGLDGQPEGMFRGLMCDGSARAVRYTLKPETLRRLFQIDDGNPIDEEL